MQVPVSDRGTSWTQASRDFKFASAVDALGMVLRDSPYKGNATLGGVLDLAEAGKGEDKQGYRAEFIELVISHARISRRQESYGLTKNPA